MKISLRAKMIASFLLLGLVPFLIISVYACLKASKALEQRVFDKLIALREAKKQKIEMYLHEQLVSLKILARSANALQCYQALMQHHQKAENGGSYDVTSASYQKIYAQHAPFFHTYVKEDERIDDLLFICAAHGHVMFAIHKGDELGIVLPQSDLNKSGLYTVWHNVVQTRKMAFVDFAPYVAHDNAPICFMGYPVLSEQGQLLGVMVVQLSLKGINHLTLQRSGLGKSGEIYLVGRDKRMRSDSVLHPRQRSVKASFAGTVAQNGVDTVASRQALAGKTQTARIVDYRDKQVLSAYTPIDIYGERWALLVEIDEDEAMVAAHVLVRAVWLLGIFTIVTVVLAGWLLALTIVRPINQTVTALSVTTTQIAAAVDEHERVAANQASALDETLVTLEQLDASANASAQQAEQATNEVSQMRTLSAQGKDIAAQTRNGMNDLKTKVERIAEQILQLSEQTSQINNITDVVGDMANQTNMLALNAAVEAARAGEHGRGFAVVAAEIRKLANQSKKSTERINAIVVDIQQKNNATVMATEEGSKTVLQNVELAQKTHEAWTETNAAMDKIFQSARKIALNASQQATAVKQIVTATNDINAGAKNTVAGIGQTRSGLHTITAASQRLQALTAGVRR